MTGHHHVDSFVLRMVLAGLLMLLAVLPLLWPSAKLQKIPIHDFTHPVPTDHPRSR